MTNNPYLEQVYQDIIQAKNKLIELEGILQLAKDANQPIAEIQVQINNLKVEIATWQSALEKRGYVF